MNYYEIQGYMSVSELKKKSGRYFTPRESDALEIGKEFDAEITEGVKAKRPKAKILAENYLKNRKFIMVNPKFQREYYRTISWTNAGLLFYCKVKARLDIEGDDIVEDLKTTSAKTRKEAERSINAFGYDIQAAAYLEISRKNLYVLTFVSKANGQVWHFFYNKEMLAPALEEYRRMLVVYGGAKIVSIK